MKIKNMIKKILRPFIPKIVLTLLNRQRQKYLLYEWTKNGCPIPPPHIVKQKTISEYRQKYKYTTLIETGTYMGDMVEVQKTMF